MPGSEGEDLLLDRLGKREKAGPGLAGELPNAGRVSEGAHACFLLRRGLDTFGSLPESKHHVAPQALGANSVASFDGNGLGFLSAPCCSTSSQGCRMKPQPRTAVLANFPLARGGDAGVVALGKHTRRQGRGLDLGPCARRGACQRMDLGIKMFAPIRTIRLHPAATRVLETTANCVRGYDYMGHNT